MSSKKVLIVIAVHNGTDFLGDCLSSLAKINYPQEDLTILAVDDCSTDNSVEYLKTTWPQVELIINQTNLGFAVSNNLGFQYALDHNFAYVYMLNQDTVVEPDFLFKAVALAESDSRIGAVQSKLMLFADPNKINSIGNEIHFLGFAFAGGYQSADQNLAAKEITYPSGAAVLLKTSALKQIGFLNPDFFMYHEDTDLGWRLWLAGWRVMLSPDSVVYHKYEFSRSIKKYYYMERNRYLIIFQNYKIATLILLAPALAVMDTAMIFYSFLNGWHRQELRAINYLFSPLAWQKIYHTRRAVQASRCVKDREIVKRFVGRIDFQDIQNPLLEYLVNPVFDFYWKIIRHIIFW
ncbi:MAG: glycosyltransferase family 2 protein [Patescibacteria group bacterium]|jgi:GT2 family glycosyltransferase|nr:glycosyltransferase family 2 protein [Patescibacteria group bacterium]